MTGQCRLITSGEMTRAGRSPACSDPTTGSRRTRTTSPRRGLVIEGMLDLLLQRVVLPLDFQVDVGHLPAAFDHRLAELLALLLIEPGAHQLRDDGAPLSGGRGALKLLQRGLGQGVGAL